MPLLRFIPAILLAFLFSAGIAHTNEAELYDPEPPANAAYVRLINLTGQKQTITLGSATLTVDANTILTPYHVVKEGRYSTLFHTITTDLAIPAQAYISLALTAENIKPVNDPAIINPIKAMIYFYNYSDAPATLFAPTQNAAIFENLPAGSAAAREINALSLDLAVRQEHQPDHLLPHVMLQRKHGYSIIYTGETVTNAENSIGSPE